MRFLNSTPSASRSTLLLIHGLDGSPEGHWQHWLADEAAAKGHNVHFPELPSNENPNLLYWLSLLHLEAVNAGPQATLVAHSLGAYLWLHYASLKGAQRLNRVLLVAPPGPDEVAVNGRLRGLLNIQLDGARIRSAARQTLVVGTSADPYNRKGADNTYAEPFGLPYLKLPQSAGHINAHSGYHTWPFALEWALGQKKFPRTRLLARKPQVRIGRANFGQEPLKQAV